MEKEREYIDDDTLQYPENVKPKAEILTRKGYSVPLYQENYGPSLP